MFRGSMTMNNLTIIYRLFYIAKIYMQCIKRLVDIWTHAIFCSFWCFFLLLYHFECFICDAVMNDVRTKWTIIIIVIVCRSVVICPIIYRRIFFVSLRKKNINFVQSNFSENANDPKFDRFFHTISFLLFFLSPEYIKINSFLNHFFISLYRLVIIIILFSITFPLHPYEKDIFNKFVWKWNEYSLYQTKKMCRDT